jgi:signal transduction histidine kinase/CheY-like chemotaxis protein/HPt (histidine-containing phosphotransfer) domain-containing protein
MQTSLLEMLLVAFVLLLGGLSWYLRREIARHRRAEQQLRRERQELEALYDTTLDLINHLDVEQLLESLVQRAGALLDTPHGYLFVSQPSSTDLVQRIGTGIFAPLVGGNIPRDSGLIGRVWASGEVVTIDNYSAWNHRRPEFGDLNLHAVINVPIAIGGQLSGVLGLANLDPARLFGVSEIAVLLRFAGMAAVTLENARLYSAARLELEERRRAEQALRRTEAELRAAKVQAEDSNRIKSAFLAQMSHEIRVPLTSVLSISDLLYDTPLDDQQRDLLAIIHTSGEVLLGVVNDILDISKIESGRVELEQAPFDLQACIEDAINLTAGAAVEKYLEIAYTIDPSAPRTIVGDMARLRQILVNLLSNAIKFTSVGEVYVAVTAAPSSDSTTELAFAVSDTGIGLPPEHMGLLFRPFIQADRDITRRYGGTGLGLSISKSLAEMMGGRIWAESEVGVGSTFHFTIRAISAPDPPNPAAHLESRRALIVNEHDHGRQALVQHVESLGLSAAATASPIEALAWIRRGEPFDVAIIELINSVMDGRMLIDELRHHRSTAALPVLLLAPLNRLADLSADEQIQGVFRKPVRLSQITRALTQLFDPNAPRRKIAAAPRQAHVSQRILIADDDPTNLWLCQYYLERLGYRTKSVHDGQQALESLEVGQFALALLDSQMPRLDGAEVARCIRERLPDGQRPYLIALTGDVAPGARERYLAAGFDDYLAKPARPHQIAQALAHFQVVSHTAAPAPDSATVFSETLHSLPSPPTNIVAGLSSSFIADAEVLVDSIRVAGMQGDARTVQRAAHQLKSSSALMGATRLAELCETLEHTAGAAPTSWPAQIDTIIDELAHVKRLLTRQAGA